MKLETAVEQTMNEDPFYELVSNAYEVYQAQGGSALSIDDYLKLHKKGLKPWHIAKIEKGIKEKTKKSNEEVRQKLFEYFYSKKKK